MVTVVEAALLAVDGADRSPPANFVWWAVRSRSGVGGCGVEQAGGQLTGAGGSVAVADLLEHDQGLLQVLAGLLVGPLGLGGQPQVEQPVGLPARVAKRPGEPQRLLEMVGGQLVLAALVAHDAQHQIAVADIAGAAQRPEHLPAAAQQRHGVLQAALLAAYLGKKQHRLGATVTVAQSPAQLQALLETASRVGQPALTPVGTRQPDQAVDLTGDVVQLAEDGMAVGTQRHRLRQPVLEATQITQATQQRRLGMPVAGPLRGPQRHLVGTLPIVPASRHLEEVGEQPRDLGPRALASLPPRLLQAHHQARVLGGQPLIRPRQRRRDITRNRRGGLPAQIRSPQPQPTHPPTAARWKNRSAASAPTPHAASPGCPPGPAAPWHTSATGHGTGSATAQQRPHRRCPATAHRPDTPPPPQPPQPERPAAPPASRPRNRAPPTSPTAETRAAGSPPTPGSSTPHWHAPPDHRWPAHPAAAAGCPAAQPTAPAASAAWPPTSPPRSATPTANTHTTPRSSVPPGTRRQPDRHPRSCPATPPPPPMAAHPGRSPQPRQAQPAWSGW